jgi:hypothetical protein
MSSRPPSQRAVKIRNNEIKRRLKWMQEGCSWSRDAPDSAEKMRWMNDRREKAMSMELYRENAALELKLLWAMDGYKVDAFTQPEWLDELADAHKVKDRSICETHKIFKSWCECGEAIIDALSMS